MKLEPTSRVNRLCWAEVGLKLGLLTIVLSFPRTPTCHPCPQVMGLAQLWAQVYSGEASSPLLVTQNQTASAEQDNTTFSFTVFPSSPLMHWAGVAEICAFLAWLRGGEKQEATGQACLLHGCLLTVPSF